MNPVAAVDAVARAPLATLQALAERLSQPAEGHDAQLPMQTQAPDNMMPGLAAALAEAAALSPALASAFAFAPAPASASASASTLAPALEAAQAETMATAQAQQGLLTLSQMAQQNQVSQAQALSAMLPTATSDTTSSIAQMALASPHGAAAAAAAPLLAVPVLMTPLQAQASPHSQRHSAVQADAARQKGQQQGQGEPADVDGETNETPEATADTPSEPCNADNALEAGRQDSRQDSQALRELLREHGSAEVQRELQAGRRVLVVLPQAQAGRGLVAARAALLGVAGARLFAHARWWAGDSAASADVADGADGADGAVWPQWRVFREGDPLHAPLLVSRADGRGCRVLLGTPAPRLLDSRSALLELPERLRFVQALGGQWSLLLVVARPGVLA